MKKVVVIILLVFIFTSCKNKSYIEKINPEIQKIISTNDFLPKSYIFSSVPKFANSKWYYYDKNKNSVIVLDNNFNFSKGIQVIGEDPILLKKYYNIFLVNDKVFVLGKKGIVILDSKTLKIKKYIHDFELISDFYYFNKEYIMGYVKNNKYLISSIKIKKDSIKIKNDKLQIPFNKDLELIEYSGKFQSLGDTLYFIKDWNGEIYKIDKNYSIIATKKIPYRGKDDLNKNYTENGFINNYYEAYDFFKFDNNLLGVMREVDFENNNISDLNDVNEKFVRKKIHLIDKDLNIKKSISLKVFATAITKKGDKLITLNYEDENIYIYSINN